MDRVKFDPKELEPIAELPPSFPGRPPVPVYNTPISRKENFKMLIRGEKPLWLPHPNEAAYLMPSCVPDNWARGLVTAAGATQDMYGGKDMFGVEWEYVPEVHGSMVRPGKPFVEDLERWEDYISFPNIDEWDWEGCAKASEALLNDGRVIKISVLTGLFERLISFIDMTDAMISLVDEDGKEAVHRLFDKLCDLYDRLFEKFATHFHADVVWFHDDWGSQRAPFFSPETVREMLLPYLKRCVDSAHKYGMAFELHSCGHVEALVPVMIEAGVDLWNGQSMNDKLKIAKLYGDKIICDPAIPPISVDATPEEVKANVQAFLDDYAGLRICIGRHAMAVHPLEYAAFYELSRKAWN